MSGAESLEEVSEVITAGLAGDAKSEEEAWIGGLARDVKSEEEALTADLTNDGMSEEELCSLIRVFLKWSELL